MEKARSTNFKERAHMTTPSGVDSSALSNKELLPSQWREENPNQWWGKEVIGKTNHTSQK